jgi:26S proteasome regulatory subunit N12
MITIMVSRFARELTIARDVYEAAALLSIKMEDPEQFERHISHLKTYYFDFADVLKPSAKQNLILALNLMGLLALNRVAEFHTELELVPVKLRSNEYISYVLRLEQYLMEGSYAKVTASQGPPDPSFDFFLSTLMVTVREEIAACSERAYKQISTSVARKLLSLDSDAELQAFAESRGWIVQSQMISFVASKEQNQTLDQDASMGLVRRTLNYAKELEQIV